MADTGIESAACRRAAQTVDARNKWFQTCEDIIKEKEAELEKKTHAAFPEGVKDDVNYDATVKAAAYLLNNQCYVSINKTKEFLREVSGGKNPKIVEESKFCYNNICENIVNSDVSEIEGIKWIIMQIRCLHTSKCVAQKYII